MKLREALGDIADKPLYIETVPKRGYRFIAPVSMATDAACTPQLSSSIGTAPQTVSGESRAAEGFWVAVLPFKYTGASADLKALAEGISDEVITGLARFSYLRVVARGSTAKYLSESGDVRAIGRQLGARYVMEGSTLRHWAWKPAKRSVMIWNLLRTASR